ncbi:hypothetical protein BBJ28_00007276 [Nothophytophthora sp. Chile5]|nr:hypothetical protein BBJ28_00007276 [Nothophytophthora sp. Chile5]
MESKATRFLTQFSRAVFQQWQQSPADRELFWESNVFLRGLLEEAVAKLPRGKLKAHLTRDLQPFVATLASLLREQHVVFLQTQQHAPTASASLSHGALLNEELTELALAQAAAASSSDRHRQLTGVLALDASIDVAPHQAEPKDAEEDAIARATRYADQFALIAARSYEAPLEQAHKRGLLLQRLASCVQQQLAGQYSASRNWECSGETAAGRQVQQLRALLERVVAQDAVALAQLAATEQETVSVGLQAPWTAFYRPAESKALQKVSFDSEMAKIYGALLALAVYFPLESDEEEEDGEDNDVDTSDDSSSEDEETNTTKNPKTLDSIAQAQLTTRQVLFAAQMRQRLVSTNGQWLVSVLSFLHSLAKPTTYLDEDEDEALDPKDRRVLLDCLGHVYTRAFASVGLFAQTTESVADDNTPLQDRALFEAALCLRQAAQFMRVERHASLPAVTTAMTQLAGVPLPESFLSWLGGEQSGLSSSVLKQVMQRLAKSCVGQAKMANALLSSTFVTADELPVVRKSYEAYLRRTVKGTKNQSHLLPQASTTIGDPSAAATEKAMPQDDGLFFVDNAGGEAEAEDKSNSSKSKSKKKKHAGKRTRVRKDKKAQQDSGAVAVDQEAPQPASDAASSPVKRSRTASSLVRVRRRLAASGSSGHSTLDLGARTTSGMAQGSGYLKKGKKGVKNSGAKPSKKATSYSHKRSAAKFTKKGNPTTEIRRGCSGMKNHGDKSVTGFINQNLEDIMASRVLQSGTTLALRDVKAHGKDRLKEINQAARTKKKSRVAQKLQALERSIKEQEEGGSQRKRPTAAAVVPRL